jgi:hypothetical protein
MIVTAGFLMGLFCMLVGFRIRGFLRVTVV